MPVLKANYKTFDPTNPTNLLKSNEEMKADAVKYFEDRVGMINEKLAAIGYTPKSGASLDLTPITVPSLKEMSDQQLLEALQNAQ